MAPARREHICFIAPNVPRLPSGGARVYYEHANHLARLGYQVSVVHSLNLRYHYPGRGLDIVRDKVRNLRAGTIRRRIAWMLMDPRVEMIFLDDLDETTELPDADVRIGTYWRTNEILGKRPADAAQNIQLIQAYETWAGPTDRVDATWRLPFHIAVVSSALRQRGLSLGVPPHRLHIVPNGLDHDMFHPTSPVRGRPPRITFLAHDNPVKGLAAAIATVGRIHTIHPNVPIIAFGGGRRPRSLPDYVSYVHRPVGRRLVEHVYNRSSIFLCTSIREGWGFPSIEAMACGAALVSTRNGGVDEFSSHGESALLCEVGDTTGLANSVMMLLDNEPRRADLAERGMASAAEFTWEKSADAFHVVVREALDRASQL